MTKLWQKNYNVNKEIEKFTVGNDYLLDKELLKWDVLGSIAHATMLNKIKVINSKELTKLKTQLKKILTNNNFKITQKDEDVHTAVENHLTKKLGNLGKKIHTARSRNDQVLLDTRLYSKDQLLNIKGTLLCLCESLLDLSNSNKEIPMPGYTHTQKAMPSSVGLWSAASLESLMDNLQLLDTAYKLNNQSPLGGAAGYGVNLNIDRKLVSNLLGFDKVQNNTLYCSNSRGKVESIILNALTQVMLDLGKLATDLILFSTKEFDYISLPKEICTGSSIMPQKQNPDVLELIRAKVSVMQSYQFQVENIIKNQFSGYNRDYQLTKEPLIKGFNLALSSLNIMNLAINKLKVNKEKCIASCTKELYATDKALDLVKKGIPFRVAYKDVALNLDKLKTTNPIKNIKEKKHLGATGNLGLNKIKQHLTKEISNLNKEKSKFKSAINKL
jgi:argininosuccinate lyase